MEQHSHANGADHHKWPPHPFQVQRTFGEVTADALAGLRAWPGFGLVVVVLAVLVALGIVGYVSRVSAGNPRLMGYYVATWVFLMSTVQAVPMIAFMSRLAKGHWARPVRRTFDLFGIAGIFTFIMFLPIPGWLPPVEGRYSIWFGWPGAPAFWDTLSMFILTATGLAILYFASRPDLAIVAEQGPAGFRRSLAASLSRGWVGTSRQWSVLNTALTDLGMFYALMFVFTHFLISSDFAMSLVPGWVSAIFPPFHVITSFAGAVATAQFAIMLLRTLGGRRDYVGVDPHWGMAKLQLAFALLYFYHSWADFITIWYGRQPRELGLLQQLYFGPYQTLFLISFFCLFVIPLLSLILNKVRVSYWGPIWVSSWVLVGLFFDRLRIYVGAWSYYGTTSEVIQPDRLPPPVPMTLSDVFIILGGLAMPALLYILVSRVIPNIAVWDIKEGILFQRIIRYMRTEARVIAKPR